MNIKRLQSRTMTQINTFTKRDRKVPKPSELITKYYFSGRVRGSAKKVSSYMSAPLGVTSDEFNARKEAFLTAFDDVTIEVKECK